MNLDIRTFGAVGDGITLNTQVSRTLSTLRTSRVEVR